MQRRMSREELIETLRREMPRLRHEYDVRGLALFGSYATGKPRRTSDVDLLVEFEPLPGLLKFIELEQHLSDILGVKVDLVMKGALKPAIGQRVLREALTI